MELDDSHRWDERQSPAICKDCHVEGYLDEPAAFTECLVGPPPPPPLKPAKKLLPSCPHTRQSLDDPFHIHRCIGGHTGGDHFCECRRWFG